MDLSHILHECRTANLRSVRALGKVMVSIGAADTWYFNWVEQNCGKPLRHIGVEYYMKKPDDLPEGVEWIANTAADMSDVESSVADVLFSGQNIEHLWQDEVAKFLEEAHRVLKQGGHLCLDSPNRTITQAYGGAHPEHMVELTVDEAVALITHAGFDVLSVKGIFTCRDRNSRELLSIERISETAPNSSIQRCVEATGDPHNSYIWWIEARKGHRSFDEIAVRKVIEQYWTIGWPERLNRLVSNIGVKRTDDQGQVFWESRAGDGGALVYGPYAPLKAGSYRVTLVVRSLEEVAPQTDVGWMDVAFNHAGDVKSRRDLKAGELSSTQSRPLSLDFSISEMTFGFQVRVFSSGAIGLSVEKQIELVTVA